MLESGLTKAQLQVGEIEVHPGSNKKPFKLGEPLMWEELIPQLPTRMSEFHEWYMKASATKDVVFHARVQVGLKTVGNGRENPLTVHVPFFCWEWEREIRTGKRN